jgi:CBS domain-containing protein
MAEPALPPSGRPAASLPGHLSRELARVLPFSHMASAHVEQFVGGATQVCFAPGEVVLEPASGPMQALWCIRQGCVTGRRGLAEMAGPFDHMAGDLFPVGALLCARPVSATYAANEDTVCLPLPAAQVQRLAQASPPFADFLHRRVMQLLELSRRPAQASWASQTLAAQMLEARLSSLAPKSPLVCGPDTSLAEALAQMHGRRVGSVLVVDRAGGLLGILTRHDIVGRVTLAQLLLSTPISQAMSRPIHALTTEHTLQDAAMAMSRHGMRRCRSRPRVHEIGRRMLKGAMRVAHRLQQRIALDRQRGRQRGRRRHPHARHLDPLDAARHAAGRRALAGACCRRPGRQFPSRAATGQRRRGA